MECRTVKKITRITPEGKTALLKWIEDNYNEIDEYIFTAHLKDNTTMMIYDCYTYFDAVAIASITTDSIHNLSHYNEFICKDRGD